MLACKLHLKCHWLLQVVLDSIVVIAIIQEDLNLGLYKMKAAWVWWEVLELEDQLDHHFIFHQSVKVGEELISQVWHNHKTSNSLSSIKDLNNSRPTSIVIYTLMLLVYQQLNLTLLEQPQATRRNQLWPKTQYSNHKHQLCNLRQELRGIKTQIPRIKGH